MYFIKIFFAKTHRRNLFSLIILRLFWLEALFSETMKKTLDFGKTFLGIIVPSIL